MHIILGGTGQVGSATVRALLNEGEKVTVVTRDKDRRAEPGVAGARIAEADIRDVETLRGVLRTGRRAFLLNPPANPSGDTDEEERANMTAILAALDGSGLEKVVLQSTYGAFEGDRCGDLTVLYAFEQALLAQPIPAAINRGGYYMSNWVGMAELVKETGRLPSFFPVDLSIPMVAPYDLGSAAARRLMSGVEDVGIEHIEGPERYTANHVADVFAIVLKRDVDVQETPREALEETFRSFGFSDAAAASYACMTRKVIDGKTDTANAPVRGEISLDEYFAAVLG
ncbi:MAG: NAD(P)H-binding protein [Roseitalea sp.]|jgi:uncharacterized protein YbjT (DUF2867 family)|nr:NAD(P)H-binding protein [Roseitalea sp.]MBO6721021.1 NAD(P)H-binding protein [Roseitalea sp.]MBO6742907.1 NAD(P)H-binding protein [Roseitalea sp.]